MQNIFILWAFPKIFLNATCYLLLVGVYSKKKKKKSVELNFERFCYFEEKFVDIIFCAGAEYNSILSESVNSMKVKNIVFLTYFDLSVIFETYKAFFFIYCCSPKTSDIYYLQALTRFYHFLSIIICKVIMASVFCYFTYNINRYVQKLIYIIRDIN